MLDEGVTEMNYCKSL